MPLTAYSISEEKELDVEQILLMLSKRDGLLTVPITEQIPDSWREYLRVDLECPCCFVNGADIVKEAVSRTSKKPIRQACFRFVVPGHRSQCDFATSESANVIAENLVEFGNAKSKLTKAVRELVCCGIQAGAFNQKKIRDMREWFFEKKIKSSFKVILDSKVPKWLDTMWRLANSSKGQLPQGLPLTFEIAAMPGFDWSTESKRVFREHYKTILDVIYEERLFLPPRLVERVESLAKRYHGEFVIDPAVLQTEYKQSLTLAFFISENYDPIRTANRSKDGGVETCVLALSALLLFVNDWDISQAINTFARISASVGLTDETLGNVIGLNPFHDYEAWSKLKQLQDFELIIPDKMDLRRELKEIEADLRLKFQA